MLKKSILLFAVALVVALPVFGQEAGTAPAGGGLKLGAVAAAFVLGVAAAAGAIAQGRATSAAAEGMSRNPGAAKDIRGMTLLGLVLIESLVIYALLIAFVVQGK
jgi:F-type H+-transporting ATPase subunit c